MQLSEVIKEFGNIVGFQSLEINVNGVVHITIHGIGDLFIDEKYREEGGNVVFIYLLRVYERFDGDLYKRALELCDYQPNKEFLVNPVLHKEQAIGFATKCDLDSFDLNTLHRVIHSLKEFHDRLASGSSY